MHIEYLIRETLPLQGFRIDSVEKYSFGVSARIVPNLRFHRRCGKLLISELEIYTCAH